MSATAYTLPDGHDARVTERGTVWGTFTRAHAFEPDGVNIVADTPEVQYVGHCRPCRHALTLARMFPARFDDGDLQALTGECHCDPDEDDDGE